MSASLREGIDLVLVALAFLGLLGLLAVILRFSVFTGLRTRGARSRLRRPEPETLARLVGFTPPNELIALYRDTGWVEWLEFELLDTRATPPRVWEIGAFIPMTERDVREARLVHHVRDGIPIAGDRDKGCYLVLPSGAIVLRSPTVPDGEVRVASSVGELFAFTARETDAGDS